MIFENIIDTLPIDKNNIIFDIKNGNNIEYRNLLFNRLRESNKKINNITIKPTHYQLNKKRLSNIETKLHYYQYQNVNWMLEIENSILHKHNTVEYYNRNIIKYNDIYLDIDKEIFYLNKPDYNTIKYNGGVLLDENSLGKTLCFITLSLQYEKNNKIEYIYDLKSKKLLKTNATLIICPNYLCNHWTNEINKHSNSNNLNIITITTKNQYEKLNYQDIIGADFVILSSNFLENSVYKNLIKNYQGNNQDYKTIFSNIAYELLNNTSIETLLDKNNIIFHIFHWNRIIIDQLENVSKKIDIISLLYRNFIWCITTQKYLESNIKQIVKLICYKNNEKIKGVDLTNNIVKMVTNKLCRLNTYDSIKKEFLLYEKKDKIIWLNFTNSELCLYNYYKNTQDDNTLMQFCSHPMISKNINEFVNKCKTVNDMKESLLNLNKIYIKKYEDHVKIIDTDINKLIKNRTNLQNIHNINDIKSNINNKLDILNNNKVHISQKIDYYNNNIKYLQNINIYNNNTCPICLNDIDKISITCCGHIFCYECLSDINSNNISKCPLCRKDIDQNDILYLVEDNINIDKFGTKLTYLTRYIKKYDNEKIIILTKWDEMMNKIRETFYNHDINSEIYKGNIIQLNKIIDNFGDNNNILILSDENNLSII